MKSELNLLTLITTLKHHYSKVKENLHSSALLPAQRYSNAIGNNGFPAHI